MEAVTSETHHALLPGEETPFMIDQQKYDPDLEAGEDIASNNKLKKVKEHYYLREKVMNGLVGAHVALLSVVGVLNIFSPLVVIACLSGMCLSPMVAFTQKELVNVVVLREIARRTAAEVDHLEEENKNLIMEITKLEGNANRLEDVEDALKKIYELQDQSLTEYADQVAVMKKNAAKIQNNTESNILKFIMYSAMKNDADGDSGLNDDEAKVIMQEISDLFGVKVHQDRFMEVVQANRNIGHIIASLKRRSVATDPDLKVFEAEHV